MRQLLRFTWLEVECCLFVTLLLWRIGWEIGREVGVIVVFHLVGLGLELFKISLGSWSYPDTGFATVGDVPLYSGFMYAAVGSYVCQAGRRLDLRITGYRPWATAAVAA